MSNDENSRRRGEVTTDEKVRKYKKSELYISSIAKKVPFVPVHTPFLEKIVSKFKVQAPPARDKQVSK